MEAGSGTCLAEHVDDEYYERGPHHGEPDPPAGRQLLTEDQPGDEEVHHRYDELQQPDQGQWNAVRRRPEQHEGERGHDSGTHQEQ